MAKIRIMHGLDDILDSNLLHHADAASKLQPGKPPDFCYMHAVLKHFPLKDKIQLLNVR